MSPEFQKNQGIVTYVVDFFGDIIKDFKKYPKKKKIIVIDAVFLTIFNRPTIDYALKNFNPSDSLPEYYNYIYWGIIILLTLWAIFYKLREKETKLIVDYNSAIKGPLSFEEHDKELFRQLERNNEVNSYLNAIYQQNFKIGILSGDSGTGKSSLLKAGLLPNINQDIYVPIIVTFSNKNLEQTTYTAFQNRLPNLFPEKNLSFDKSLPLLIKKLRPKLVILIFDQFEQIFTQNFQPHERDDFLNNIVAVYKNCDDFKLLISIRSDFLHVLYELQSKLEYSLIANKNYLRLQSFTPDQAVCIFKTIGQLEGIENIDDNFLLSFSRQELANKKDGLISPLDLQIILLTIKKKNLTDKLTSGTFNQLGGVRGILKEYLIEELEVPNIFNKDGDILSALISLIDINDQVRAGQLTIEEIANRNLLVNKNNIIDILNWLVETKLVRFIDSESKYELAHEKLIDPILTLYNQNSTELQKANRLLNRKTIEWANSNRKRYYLLNFSEYYFIHRYRKSITWGDRFELKKDLLRCSLKKFKIRAFSLLVFLGAIGLIYLSYNSSFYIKSYRIKSDIISAFDKTEKNTGGEFQIVDNMASIDPLLAYKLYEESEDYGSDKFKILVDIAYNLPASSPQKEILLNQAIAIAKQPGAFQNEGLGYIATKISGENLKQALQILKTMRNDVYPFTSVSLTDSINKSEAISRIASAVAKSDPNVAIRMASELPRDYKNEAFSSIAASLANRNPDFSLNIIKQIPRADFHRCSALISLLQKAKLDELFKKKIYNELAISIDSIQSHPDFFIGSNHIDQPPLYVTQSLVANALPGNYPKKNLLLESGLNNILTTDFGSQGFILSSSGFPSDKMGRLCSYYVSTYGRCSEQFSNKILKEIKGTSGIVQISLIHAILSAKNNEANAREYWNTAKNNLNKLSNTHFDLYFVYQNPNLMQFDSYNELVTEILEYLSDFIEKNPTAYRTDMLFRTIAEAYESESEFKEAYWVIGKIKENDYKALALEDLYKKWHRN